MTLILPTFPGLTWPRDVSFGLFNTDVETSVGGIDSYFVNQTQPKRRFTLNISALDAGGNNSALLNNSLQTLQAFFFQCYGRGLCFQYRDPDDGTAASQRFGTGDAVTTAFQLARSLSGFAEQIYCPTGSPNIYVNGVRKTVNTDYTISTTGKVTFVAAPANGAVLTWTGKFSWWCNWDTDAIDASAILANVYEAKKLSFVTRIFG